MMIDLLQDEITTQARQRPEAVAIVGVGQRLTYAELERVSNQLARQLRHVGCRRGDRVCLLMPNGVDAVVTLLGALKADAAWIPLDPSCSAAFLREVVAASGARWILAGAHTDLLDELFADAEFAASHDVGWLGGDAYSGRGVEPLFTWTDVATRSSSAVASFNRPSEIAYLRFSSGEDGAVQELAVTHASVLHFIRRARGYFGTTAEDRVSWDSALHLGLCTFDIFGTLGAGATLYPTSPELGLVPHRLAEFIRDAELTQWCSNPDALSGMVTRDVIQRDDFPKLKRVLWCGEVLPTRTLEHWMQRLPHVTFASLHDPTESAAVQGPSAAPPSYQMLELERPIGYVVADEDADMLTDAQRPAIPGLGVLTLDAMTRAATAATA